MPFPTLSLLACLAIGHSLPPTRVQDTYHGVHPEFMDRKVSPTQNFFRYANGSWLDQTTIPRDRPDVSALAQARARNEELLWRIVAPAAVDTTAPAGSLEQIVGEFLRTGLNEELAERQRFQPIRGELDRIAAIQTRGDVMAELARLHRWSMRAGFLMRPGFDYGNSKRRIVWIGQGGLSLAGRESYLREDGDAKNLRAKLGRCMQETLRLLGDEPQSVAGSAEKLVAMETRLAKGWLPESEVGNVEQNFHLLTPSQLISETGGADWGRYFSELGVGTPDAVNVAQLGPLRSFGAMLQELKVSDWRLYLRWQFARAMSPFLSSEFVQQAFALKSAIDGQEQIPSREECVLEEADVCLGAELGQLMARSGFAKGYKPRVEAMAQNIRLALHRTIEQLDWMGPATKTKALEKLDRMQVNVCYPENWPDSAGLSVTGDSYAQNVLRAREFAFQRLLDGLKKPVDSRDWDIRAYAADARYSPSMNAIYLPAGMLQAPYFDPDADDAANYGSVGTVIGHEMMHAFDGRGRKFDANGNLNNWWSAADAAHYEEHQKAFVAQYDTYGVADGLKVSGKQTLEENIADLGGLTVSYAALKISGLSASVGSGVGVAASTGSAALGKIGGFTADQRFFLSFGQLFRAKERPECLRTMVETDPHAPPQVRVQGVLRNVPEFWRAFGAEPPVDLLKIW